VSVRRETIRRGSAARDAALAGLEAARQRMRASRSRQVHAITIGRPLAELTDAPIAPLARLRAQATLEFREAPGARGTEVLARPQQPGRLANGHVRQLLRAVKQVAETGHEVSLVTGPNASGPVAARATALLDRALSGEVPR